MSYPAAAGLQHNNQPRRSAMMRSLAIVVVIVLLAVGAFAALSSVRISALIKHLESASQLSNELMTAVMDEPEVAPAKLKKLKDELNLARTELNTWELSVLSHTPWLGKNFSAVSTLVDALDEVSTGSIPTLIDVSELIDLRNRKLRNIGSNPQEWADTLGKDGGVLKAAPGAISDLGAARKKVKDIDTKHLLPDVRQGVEAVEKQLDDAYGTVAPIQKGLGDMADRINEGISGFSLIDLLRSLL